MFNKPISHKAAQFTESVIREMTRLAMEHQAINLSQGFPDFAAPEILKKAAADAIFADVNQYAITWGSKSFRDALVFKTKKFLDIDIDPERERSEEHTSELQSQSNLVCRLLLEKKKY